MLEKLRAKWISWFQGHNEPNSSRWFLLDRELTDPRDDEFLHKSVVETLEQYIRDNPVPPYAIGIYGRWGQGKSSVARLLLGQLEAGGHKVIKEPISLWHYSPDELPSVINYRLTKGHSRPKNAPAPNARITFSENDATASLRDRLLQEFKMMPTVVPAILVSVICIAALYLIASLVGYFASPESIAFPSLDGMLKTLTKWAWGPVVVALISYAFGRLKTLEVSRTLDPLTKAAELADDVQVLTQDTRPIILLDDLDRLSAAKMVRALEAVKAYLSHKSAIFIIPCDDGVLRTALETMKNLDEPDGERFLEKFFQYSIRLPQQRRRDMKQYAKTMWTTISHPLTASSSEHYVGDLLEDILDILIHTGIETPRQVKKVLNEFSTGLLLCLERERSGHLRPAGLTKGSLLVVAKLSVLRADFQDFYAALTSNQTLLESMNKVLSSTFTEMEAHEVELVIRFLAGTDYVDSIPEIAEQREFVGITDDVRARNKSLLRFLSMTRHVSNDSMKPFLFFKTDETRGRLQSSREEDLEKDVLTGNWRPVRSALEASNDNGKSVIDLVVEVLGEAPPGLHVTRAAQVAINLADLLQHQETLMRQLANGITSRYHEMVGNLTEKDPEKLFLLLEFATDNLSRIRILSHHLTWASHPDRSSDEHQPWAWAVLMAPKLIVDTNLTSQARPVVRLLGLQELVEVASKLTLDSALVNVLGGQFFEDTCQSVANRGDHPEPIWERFILSAAHLYSAAFPEHYVAAVSMLLTNHHHEIRAMGKELLSGGQQLSRSARRDVLMNVLETASEWPRNHTVDDWLAVVQSELDTDPTLLSENGLDQVAATLAHGFGSEDPEAVHIALKHARHLDPYMTDIQRRIYFDSVVDSLDKLDEPGGVLTALCDALEVQLEAMPEELHLRLFEVLEQNAGHLNYTDNLQIAIEIAEAIASVPVGSHLLSLKVTSYLDSLSDENLAWQNRSEWAIALVRAINNSANDVKHSVASALGSLVRNGNQNQVRIGIMALQAFKADLSIVAPVCFDAVYSKMDQQPLVSDLECRVSALEILGYGLSYNLEQEESWSDWVIEAFRKIPEIAISAVEAGPVHIRSVDFGEILEACEGDSNLWSRAMAAWGQRALLPNSTSKQLDDLLAVMDRLSSSSELISLWLTIMPKDGQAKLSSAALQQASVPSESRRLEWIDISARFRKNAGAGAQSGLSEVVARLLALPVAEVVDILTALPEAYPEPPKEERGIVEQSIRSFIERTKNARELRAITTFTKRVFARMPTKIKQQILQGAESQWRVASRADQSIIAEILGELGEPKGKFEIID